jgi:hypothetical protein
LGGKDSSPEVDTLSEGEPTVVPAEAPSMMDMLAMPHDVGNIYFNPLNVKVFLQTCGFFLKYLEGIQPWVADDYLGGQSKPILRTRRSYVR